MPPKPYRLGHDVDPWTSEAIALLGQVYDDEIGASIGVTREAVRQKREALGIPAAPLPPGRKPRGAPAPDLRIRITADERATFERAAGRRPIATWARETLVDAAKRVK